MITLQSAISNAVWHNIHHYPSYEKKKVPVIAGRQENADILKGMRCQVHDTKDKHEVINYFQTWGDNVQ